MAGKVAFALAFVPILGWVLRVVLCWGHPLEPLGSSVILGGLPVALGSSLYAYKRAVDRRFAIVALIISTGLVLFQLLLIVLLAVGVLTWLLIYPAGQSMSTISTSTDTIPSQPKRRRFQFGMRSLLIAVLICCLVFGWIARQLQKARNREGIVAELDQVQVYVYQYEPTALGRLTRASPTFDNWLRTRFGDSLLSSPSAISAHHIGDDGVEYLIRQLHYFPSLRKLHVGAISDEKEARLRSAFPDIEVEKPDFAIRSRMGMRQQTEP